MGIRTSASRRTRFDFPLLSKELDNPIPYLEAYKGIGPFTRSQMIRLLWRVKQIEFKSSVTFTIEIFDDQSNFLGTRDQTLSVDVRLNRSIYDFIKKNASMGPFDERLIFKSMMSGYSNLYLPFSAFDLYFTGSNSFSSGAIKHSSKDVRNYKTDNYWLTNITSDGYGNGISVNSYKPLPPGPNEQELWGSMYLYVGQNIDPINGFDLPNGKLEIGGDFVSIPLAIQARASGKNTIVKSSNYRDASASIKVTEWFEYATTKGLPAWDKLTGRPINGGPAA